MKIQLAKGVRDTPPEEKIVKNQVVDTLQKVFENYGFAPLETPLIERYETLAAKFAAGDASDALTEIFQLTDQGKRKLALRFDLTVPLSRFIAMNPTMKMPFKRYQVGRVFRDGPIKLGRYREFWQMDIDTVGTKSMLADAEIIAMAASGFNKLNLNVNIKVNNRKLLNGILEQAGIKKNKDGAIIAIDKLDKIGAEGVKKELIEKGFLEKSIDALFLMIKEGITLKDLKNKITSESGKEGLQELEEVFDYLKQMGVKKAVFDVSLARGLAYYTGTVFEVFLNKGKITSSLAGGGRYDEMIGQFLGGGRVIPAVGISFGIAPIMDTINELNKEIKKTPAQVYVVPMGTIKESLAIASKLREAGLSVDFSLGKKGMSKNLQYANSLNIPYVIILGENELSKNKVLLRDMKTGDQKLLTVEQTIKKLIK
jgi:histidyl-tRNA synthetase